MDWGPGPDALGNDASGFSRPKTARNLSRNDLPRVGGHLRLAKIVFLETIAGDDEGLRGLRSARSLSAAGFIAIRTSIASPGYKTSSREMQLDAR